MKFLVVGLGSMGKRRIRNLQVIGGHTIAGFDIRDDRLKEVTNKYHVTTFANFHEAIANFSPDALIISTPPQYHMDYAFAAFEYGISCFIEASVVDAERILELHHLTENSLLLMAPSCTMRYFRGPKKIKALLMKNVIGRPLNISYQTGQYLPDWHPWEKIEDYYVSVRETGGCREIVPFELTWLNDLFGLPVALSCVKAKLTEMNADIDDIYHCLLKYPDNILANITVDVISRPKATRELRILGTEGQLVFSMNENCVRYINTGSVDWVKFSLGDDTIEEGYINPEEPYIAEMNDFINATITGDKTCYPNTLFADYQVLKALEQLENLSKAL